MESSVLHCVNPFDVNPISGTGLSVVQDENSVGKPMKLEMEEFSDLAPFLPRTTLKATSNVIDELNTPVFDIKGPFNFMVSENTYIESPPAADPFECDINRTGNSAISNKQLNDFSVYSNNIQEKNNSEIVNIIQGSEANILFTTTESDQGNIYILNGNGTPIHVQCGDLSASLIKIEDTNSVVSVNSIENQSNISEYSVNTNMSVEEQSSSPNYLEIESPEDSNSSCTPYKTHTVKKVSKLKLEMQFDQNRCINTPEVLDSVVELESSIFNIFDFISDKDLTGNTEDIHFEPPSTSRELETINSEELSSVKTRKRKARHDDDDEDYFPPSENVFKKESSDSEGDSDTQLSSPKRGRPSRRRSSVSSEHSDASKYRELRDKNNEASRKSRLKRKMKDQTLQKEADELHEKNIKLKAQVAEYEKMVNNFRSNLFKIMLKK